MPPRSLDATTLPSRTRMGDLSVALVEDLRTPGENGGSSRNGFSSSFQVCLPYRGLFVWHVDGEDVVGDANQIVYVRAGEPYRISGPVGAYSELVITPALEVVSELVGTTERKLFEHPLFRRRAVSADA